MTDMVEILRGLGMDDIAEEIERLRARIAELETQCAATKQWHAEVKQALQDGALSRPEEPQAFGIIHDVPPSTPR